jgi:antigen flippase
VSHEVSTEQTSTARRSTLVLAASSGVAFALNVARTKLLALAWGPGGVGQMGLMQAAMGTANLITGLGVDGLVARDVAASPRGSVESDRAIAAATRGAMLLSTLAAAVSTIGLGLYLTSVSVLSPAAALLLGLGAGVSILGSNFRAVLSGLGAAKETALATVIAAVLALLGALTLGWAQPSPPALAIAVAMVPLATMLALGAFVSKRVGLGGRAQGHSPFRDLLHIARRASLFTVAGVLPLLGQTLVRTIAATSLSEDGLGQMQAAAGIAAISTSLLASSIGPVLIPQLSNALSQRQPFSRLLTEHTAFLVTLYAPIAIAIATAPTLVLSLLYSGRFSDGAPQLGWQLVGEVLRMPVWLMATSLVVLGRGRAYLLLELVGLLTQVGGMALVAKTHDSASIGVVFAVSAVAQFALATFLLGANGFRWNGPALLRVGLIAACCAVLAVLSGTRTALVLGGCLLVPASVLAARLLLSLRKRG